MPKLDPSGPFEVTEVTMECINCKNKIKTGTEIVVDELLRERAHCPYCLQILSAEPTLDGQSEGNGNSKREKMRTLVREQFVARLLDASPDGKIRCPVCEHTLNEVDERLLRTSEHLRCHLCGHDLAALAYRQEVYHEQRWLPVVFALEEQLKEKGCADCCYLGAVAKKCRNAYTWMPEAQSRQRERLTKIVRHPYRTVPDCDLELCPAIAQYRKLAGVSLLLL
jgi:hypothetical protein